METISSMRLLSTNTFRADLQAGTPTIWTRGGHKFCQLIPNRLRLGLSVAALHIMNNPFKTIRRRNTPAAIIDIVGLFPRHYYQENLC